MRTKNRIMRRSENSGQRGTSINDLPQIILCSILSLLPLKEQARSSTVCRAWRNLWLSSPSWKLEFSSFPRVKNKKLKFEELVDKVIFFPGRPGIQHMRLIHSAYDLPSQKASLWIESLLSQRILGLDLNIADPIPPPLSLFRSETLVELRLCLNHEHIRLPATVSLPRLKVFCLRKALFIGSISFQRLIDGCVILVTLELKECAVIGPEFFDITIPQSTLKKVIFENCHLFHGTKLHMSTVNLKTFHFKGLNLAGKKHDLNVQALVESAIFESEEFHYIYTNSRSQGFAERYGENMSSILAAFCNTKYLVLSDWCIEYLTNIPNGMRFPPFMNLENLCLTMWPNSGHMYVIAYLLRFSPWLRSLSVIVTEMLLEGIYDGEMFDYSYPPDFLSREMVHYNLKKIEFKKYGMLNEELELIRFLLKNAMGLEQLTTRCHALGDASVRKSMREKIKSYPRASAKVKLCIN